MTTAPTIRAECPGDHDSITSVVTAAFGSAGEARLVEAIRASTDFLPQLSLVAELEGQIVGHVMISHVMLEDGDVHRKIASLAAGRRARRPRPWYRIGAGTRGARPSGRPW